MIFTKDVLFIHVPKTGGMALTSYLLDLLPGDKYYTAPEPDPTVGGGRDDVFHLAGARHETLDEAEQTFAPYGFHLSEFPLIIVGARNPYSLEVSRYAYLQSGHDIDKGSEQDLAMSSDFATFARRSDRELSIPIDRYYTIDGRIPHNLWIIRQEHMDADLAQAMKEIGIAITGPVPVDNTSLHDDYRTYYTAPSEAIVHDKYRWIFDQGWYERLDLTAKPATPPTGPAPAHKLPIFGCLQQVGPTSGAYSDGWLGPELRFRVSGATGADYLTVEFFVPEGPEQEVSLQVGRDTFRGRFPSGAACWTVPCLIPDAAPTLVTMTASYSWIPADRVDGSRDVRVLSFVLSRLTFSRAARSRSAVNESDDTGWDETVDDSLIKS